VFNSQRGLIPKKPVPKQPQMRDRRSAEGKEDKPSASADDECEPGKFPFPGVDKDTLVYDCSKARLLGSIFFRYEKISENPTADEDSTFQVGHFAVQEQYLYRLTEENQAIDVFNMEFCEMPTLTLDQGVKDELGLGQSCFAFQVVKEGGKRVQFCTADKEEWACWLQALGCYVVGIGIHSFYQLEDLLGQGSFGIVYLAKPTEETVRTMGNLNSNSKVAIKQINKSKLRSSGQGIQGVVNEIRVHWALRHCDNLLKLYQLYESPSNIYLILEFQRQGSLLSTLQA
jgi:hypothetical protein